MTLADFTRPALIVPRLNGGDRAHVLREMCERLHRGQRITDALTFFHAVLNREYLGETAFEPGLVVPHARHGGVNELTLVLGRSIEPIAWERGTVPSVHLVFLLAVPPTSSVDYLRLISAIARLSSERCLIAWLRIADTELQLLEILALVHLRPAREAAPAALAIPAGSVVAPQ